MTDLDIFLMVFILYGCIGGLFVIFRRCLK